jgi:hypothetical protein
MRDLIEKLEITIKEEFKKKGFSWLIWGVTIGFIVLNAILSLFLSEKSESITKEKVMPNSTSMLRNEERIIPITPKEKKVVLPDILKSKGFGWSLLALSFTLMFIENFLKIEFIVGGWHIVLYLLTLLPLLYLSLNKKLNNPHIKWFFPLLFVLIFDMFYYNNNFVQNVVPLIFYLLVVLLYLSSMHHVHSFYQTLLPKFNWVFDMIDDVVAFLGNLFTRKDDKKIYARIGLALLITIPFLAVFVALLFSADTNFGNFLKNMVDFDFSFNPSYLLTVPIYFSAYLLFYLYAFSNVHTRTAINTTKPLDMLVVGIFLGMINLLFMTFIAIQLPFLLGDNYLPEGTNISEFAREGFFQLMMVMGIVLLIFLFIMRRFKAEKTIIVLLSGLLIQTIVMGVVSLKKMYLYQSLKGVTVMRYYVEWFDYFLLLVLALGLWFIVRKLSFSKLLNLTAVLGLLSLTIITSLNVDAMVARHNISKFKENLENLDKQALRRLSIDALPVI